MILSIRSLLGQVRALYLFDMESGGEQMGIALKRPVMPF